MAKFYESDNTLIPRVLRDHINTWGECPVKVTLESSLKTVPAMMIQQLASYAKKRKYIDGSYIGQCNFAVYAAIDAEDTASRIDALAVLNDLGEWLSERDESEKYIHLPDIGNGRKAISITMTSTPSIAARHENGVEEYQATFSLEYMALT